ncbi:mannosyltransferase [Pseudomonas putida]|nr:mannosyltransferase [Pseudomonas putida]
MSTSRINAVGMQYVRDHLSHIPRPDREASRAIRQWLAQQGHDLDPDQTDVVTLHYRGNQAVIVQRLSLTQAMLSDWQGETAKDLLGQLLPGHWAGTLPDGPLAIVERLPEPGVFDNSARFSVFNGLFRRTSPARYDSSTHLPVDVEAMQQFIWDLDFHSRFVGMLDDYWQQATQTHRQSLQISFIAACNKQVQEGSLSDTGRLMAWQAAGLMAKAPGLQARPLNVYGYAATDLICITDPAQPHILLYLPGNASPLHEFDGMAALQHWFAEQCRNNEKRLSLRQYFKLADTPDGLDFSGLDTALEGLGAYPGIHHRSPNRPGFTVDGPWRPSEYVNYKADKYSPLLEGELFAALTQRQRERSYADADFIITRDAQVTKARWRGYLVASLNLLAPLALVVPELIPLLAVGGVAQFGLGLDQAINGKTLADKDAGVSNIAFGLLNAAPLLLLPANRTQVFFPGKRWRFVMPTRLNDQLGYPLSPIKPPVLPEHYFSSSAARVQPILTGSAAVAMRVTRLAIDEVHRLERLQAVLDERSVDLLYDTEQDAFILKSDANEVLPTYYEVSEESHDLTPIAPSSRPVTDEMRMSTLRALGVDIQLPIEMPTVSEPTHSLPKQILSIWIGDKVIPDELLEVVATNSRRLQKSKYTYRLYLSKADTEIYEINKGKLETLSPRLQVVPLEDQPFYNDFKETEYFEQYQKALDGTHYASASDVLRYPLLNAEGGLYMDIDDTLRTLGDNPDTEAVIDYTRLATTQDGLVLGAPVNNELLEMHCAYNTNMIGSHADNSTLDIISETMRERFIDNPTFYDTRPLRGERGYDDYATNLSRMTGPGLLNHVVDQELPRLSMLRHLTNLETIPQNNPQFLTEGLTLSINQARQSDQALSQVVTIGNYHSWGKP